MTIDWQQIFSAIATDPISFMFTLNLHFAGRSQSDSRLLAEIEQNLSIRKH